MRSILILIIAYLLIPSVSFSAQANEKSENSENKQDTSPTSKTEIPETKEDEGDSLDFSGTGRPGQQTAGESRGSCGNLENSLQAVIPVSHAGKTVMEHPNFWVYLPTASDKISHLEFVLQNEARKDIWRSQVRVNAQAGYQNFSLPATQSPLKAGQWYRWYVKVYCKSQVASAAYVQGWIQRVPATSQLDLDLQSEPHRSHLVYGNHGVWYDAVNHLLRLDPDKFGSLALEQDWRHIIEAGGLCSTQLPQAKVIHEAINHQ